VLDECILIHTIHSAGITVFDQIELLVLRAFGDAVIHESHLFPVFLVCEQSVRKLSKSRAAVLTGHSEWRTLCDSPYTRPL
jgi:hypothetical protein